MGPIFVAYQKALGIRMSRTRPRMPSEIPPRNNSNSPWNSDEFGATSRHALDTPINFTPPPNSKSKIRNATSNIALDGGAWRSANEVPDRQIRFR